MQMGRESPSQSITSCRLRIERSVKQKVRDTNRGPSAVAQRQAQLNPKLRSMTWNLEMTWAGTMHHPRCGITGENCSRRPFSYARPSLRPTIPECIVETQGNKAIVDPSATAIRYAPRKFADLSQKAQIVLALTIVYLIVVVVGKRQTLHG